jgi:hypothetical protein
VLRFFSFAKHDRIRTSKKFVSAIFLLSSFLASCSSERTREIGLYNIDSLVTTQAGYLLSHNAALTKTARLDDSEKVSEVIPKDSMEWENELAIFSELNAINKPINKGAYNVEVYKDAETGLDIKSFSTKEELPVKSLKIFYNQSPDSIRRIEAKYNESNSLYSSGRFLTMEFSPLFGRPLLHSYSINGGQKMVLDDSVRYDVKVIVSFNK